MITSLFQHKLYQRLSLRSELLLRLSTFVLLMLCIVSAMLAYNRIESLIQAQSTQQRLQEKTRAIESVSVGEDIGTTKLAKFRRDVSTLQKALPEVSMSPLALLNLIEQHLPADVRLQGFDYVRAREEVVLKLESHDKSSVQAFVAALERLKQLKEIQLKDGRRLSSVYLHTVVIRI